MPAVKFLQRLSLEEKISFLDGHYLEVSGNIIHWNQKVTILQ